ncbi:MAG: CaiB/BaiF CoA transferase family protein [Burkholderiaceae bacterium]
MEPMSPDASAGNFGALHGLLVLEFGARVGASVAGSLLAQLGATVVFVEAARAGGFSQPKWSCREQYAAGKLSLAADLGDAADRELLDSLAQGADVLLLSSDADAAAYGGSPWPRAPNGPVVCDVTAFGTSGPLRNRAGPAATDAQIQAMTGVMECTGTSDGPPRVVALPLVEQLAGIYAAAGVLAALRQRRMGASSPVEIALYDVAFSTMTSFLAPALSGQGGASATRVGNRHTMAAPWNVYRARDGWVLLCAGNDEQWQRLWSLMAGPEQEPVAYLAKNAARVVHAAEVDAIVQAWTSVRTIEACVARLLEQGIPCGPVAPLDGYPREANLHHRAMIVECVDPVSGRTTQLPGSPFRMSRTAGRVLGSASARDADRSRVKTLVRPSVQYAESAPAVRPLAGVRVLEIGHYTTAPVASRLLAALGAEIIKVEPPEGEAVRRWPPARNGQGVFFTFQNADKQSIALEIDSAEGRRTLLQLVAKADVLIENLRPGALARKGYGHQDMLALNPRLVFCSISGFGLDSLYPGRPAFDSVIQAMSGLMGLIRIDGMPLKTGPSMADVMGAAFSMTAIQAALESREHTGKGQHLDLAMQDICAWATQSSWNDAGQNRSACSVLQCADGHVLVTSPVTETAALQTRFESTGRSRATVAEALAAAGLDAEPVLDISEVVAASQTLERGLWCMAIDEGVEYPVLASPVRLLQTPSPMPRPGPRLGRDTDAIMGALP